MHTLFDTYTIKQATKPKTLNPHTLIPKPETSKTLNPKTPSPLAQCKEAPKPFATRGLTTGPVGLLEELLGLLGRPRVWAGLGFRGLGV